jgi:predicted amidohydrolase
MDGDTVRVSLLQIDVSDTESTGDRRERAAALVRAQAGADLVVLPELWTVGAFAADRFASGAEPVPDGPTTEALSAAALDAGVWLHGGSVVERGPENGELFNTSLLFAPDGTLTDTYRKIHRFGFDTGEATIMSAGREPVLRELPFAGAVLGLATCYDLRFPELFRQLTTAGVTLQVVSAGWPEARRPHWSLLARARAVENQTYVLACAATGTHAGVQLSGHSVIVDPWGEVVAEAGPDETVLTAEIDPAYVAKVRADFPVLRDRVLQG